jgi:hypothetical protein
MIRGWAAGLQSRARMAAQTDRQAGWVVMVLLVLVPAGPMTIFGWDSDPCGTRRIQLPR